MLRFWNSPTENKELSFPSFASAGLGAATNAINGWVSPLYFVTDNAMAHCRKCKDWIDEIVISPAPDALASRR